MRFIGTKIIIAEAMTRAAYNVFRSWALPADENGADEGYLVEYQDGGKPNVPGREGYVSWSPKEQFDNAYRPCEAMTFGLALEALKRGHSIGRAGWNGKGQFVILIQGSNKLASIHGFGFGEVLGEPTFGDTMFLRTVDNRLIAWTPSQSDALAEDWQIVGAAEQPLPIETKTYADGTKAIGPAPLPAVSPSDTAIEQEIQAEGFTFDQFVQFGRDNGGNIVNGMPWSFNFKGHPVTHENDRCYLVGVNAGQLRFTPDDVLVIAPDGSLSTRLPPGIAG